MNGFSLRASPAPISLSVSNMSFTSPHSCVLGQVPDQADRCYPSTPVPKAPLGRPLGTAQCLVIWLLWRAPSCPNFSRDFQMPSWSPFAKYFTHLRLIIKWNNPCCHASRYLFYINWDPWRRFHHHMRLYTVVYCPSLGRRGSIWRGTRSGCGINSRTYLCCIAAAFPSSLHRRYPFRRWTRCLLPLSRIHKVRNSG